MIYSARKTLMLTLACLLIALSIYCALITWGAWFLVPFPPTWPASQNIAWRIGFSVCSSVTFLVSIMSAVWLIRRAKRIPIRGPVEKE